MKPLLAVGIAAILLSCGTTARTRREEITATAHFDSAPSGAEVLLAPAPEGPDRPPDETTFRPVGTTPCTVREILLARREVLVRSFPPGYEAEGPTRLEGNLRWVRLRRPGYRELTDIVSLEPGASFRFDMEPLPGGEPPPAPREAPAPPASSDLIPLELTSTPDRAELWVDGEYLGSTPAWIPLETGKHRLRITKPGHVSWEREITIRPGSAQRVHAELAGE